MVTTKRCTKCSIEKTIDQFSKDHIRKDGLGCHCKGCIKQYQFDNKKQISGKERKYYKTHKEQISEKRREYRGTPTGKAVRLREGRKYRETPNGKAVHAKAYRKYRSGNKKQIAEWSSIYRKTPNGKKIISKARRKYYKTHKEQISEKNSKYHRNYYKTHKEQKTKKIREYKKTPNGKATAIRGRHKRRAKGKNVETTLTATQWVKILALQNHRCAKCEKPFDKRNKPTRDHIIPLSKGGGLTFENIEAVCRSCNCSKGANLDKEKIVTWMHLNHPSALIEAGA